MQGGSELSPAGVDQPTQERELQPTLVVRDPEGLRGQAFALRKAEQNLGRADGNDVRLEDPYVSRRHAVIRRAGRAVIVEDAGSSAGVVVNDVLTTEPTLLYAGDRIRLGGVELELVNGPRAVAPPPPPADSTAIYAPPPQPQQRFDIDSQRAGSISNVAGDQYNQYALRIAPMHRRARRLMRLGFAIFLAGLAVFAVGFAAFAAPLVECDFDDPAGCAPPDFKGWGVAAAGTFVAMIGMITIIVSVFMKRQARREEERL
jgi:hypothetical protein